MSAASGIYITGGDTAVLVRQTAGQFNQDWAALPDDNGDQSVVRDPDNGKLTLHPGKYQVSFQASLQTEDASSGDDVGKITFGLRLDGVQITGLKCAVDCDVKEKMHSVAIVGVVEVGESDTGDLTVYAETNAANTNEILVEEAQLVAMRIA